jgi:hypothetical protein
VSGLGRAPIARRAVAACRAPGATRTLLALAALGAPALPLAPGLGAQAADSVSPPTGCYRFAFGTWSPPLDWRGAGHDWGPGGVQPTERYPTARPTAPAPASQPASRGSASWETFRSDSVLVIYPPWWPVGVMVHLAAPLIAAGDTVRGVATAFVADANVPPPTSSVRAWRGRCSPPGP